MKTTIALALLTGSLIAAPLLAQEPPFPAPGGPDGPGMTEGAQVPAGAPCCRAGREGAAPPHRGGPGAPDAGGARGGPGMLPSGPPPEQVLKEALALTDEQVTALEPVLEARPKPTAAQLTQLGDAERTLADALRSERPDPAQLGALLLKVKAARAQVDPGEALRAQLAKILTPAQKQKLDQLVWLRKSLQAAELLQRLGV